MSFRGGRGTPPDNRRGLAIVLGLVMIFAGCLFVQQQSGSEPSNTSGAGGNTSPATPATPPTRSTLPPAAQNVPTWTGELRLANGLDFRSGEPEQASPYSGTLTFTDYQDRFSHGGRGSRLIAPWSAAAAPSYDECTTALQTNAYGPSESGDLPISEGAGYCVNDSDEVIVFVRLLGRDGDTALLLDATVWRYNGA
jgi:hypothetical protein